MPWPQDHKAKTERFQFRIATDLKEGLEEHCHDEGFENPSAWLRSLAKDAVDSAKKKKKRRKRT